MLGYLGYVNLSDGQHSVCVQEPSKITIVDKKGIKTEVYVAEKDRGDRASTTYCGRFVMMISGYRTTQGKRLISERLYGKHYKDKNTYIPYHKGTYTGKSGEMVYRVMLGKDKGICYTKFSNGRFMAQRFNYANGQQAYQFRTSKDIIKVRVRYPNGKIRAIYHFYASVFKDYLSAVREGKPFVECFEHDIHPRGAMLYDKRGKVIELQMYRDNQLYGRIIRGGIEYFMVNGMEVNKKLYYAKPEQINPKSILRINNAQFRAMMIKKVGINRIIEHCKGKVIHQQGDMALIDFKVKPDRDTEDKVLRILKVKDSSTEQHYYLQVPPFKQYSECEKARQWTFGVDDTNPFIAFAKET